MEEEASDAPKERAAHDRETLRLALCMMTVEQLRGLRSTIVRLKHLPFTELTEALFTEEQGSGEQTEASHIREDALISVHDFCGRCRSETTRLLFEDVENILRAKEDADRR